jgi:Ca2+-transporting ATPase
VEAIVDQLGMDRVNGLSASEVSRRLALYGPNALEERKRKSPWRLLWEQLTATMVVVLLIAAAVSIFLGDYAEAIAILAIVVLNALLGFTQEQRAERAMSTLQQLAAPMVKVCRHGRVYTLSARELVPGDLVLLEAGNLVPADGRLIESVNLRVQEAALTGEAAPVDKDTQRRSDPDLPLGDRCNMVYMGTVVTYGRGRAVITATGMYTTLGGIAAMLQTVERKATPLQRRLAQLGRGLAIAALILVAVVFVIGTARGEEIRLMILTALSLAVAAVPEGLPAVVTIALALSACSRDNHSSGPCLLSKRWVLSPSSVPIKRERSPRTACPSRLLPWLTSRSISRRGRVRPCPIICLVRHRMCSWNSNPLCSYCWLAGRCAMTR